MGLGKDYAAQDCSLARALEVVGERWTLLIVRDAFYGVRRFSDFQAHLDIPRAVLSSRLHALTEAGVLDKHGHEYVLTSMGTELWPVVHTLARWGERHLDGGACRLFLHAACGSRLGPDGTCPECDRFVAPEDVEIHVGPGLGRRRDAVTLALREPHRMLEPIET
ncbi:MULTISPECIES: winged helix-turn-helix transcriptional regulator [Thermomonosporaceae]|uniref:winged helix-turn-helix transcriptional regulator n=1 Tax=Thermomonosporaceae TaxID=2012 RepID=UPI00255A9AF6|nr:MULTISPECIES: helix-turn-helix domain-containing protein [Thermomonosporaceae]MDL4777215.1 helix-turn-helix domain-containing protein [Actinomadura xylanilytica]